MGGAYHSLPLQGQRHHPWARKLSRLQIANQVMKVLERLAEHFLRPHVRIDDMQFGFMPGRSTTDTIFIACQLQGKLYAINKTLYLTFVNLEKAFNGVPRGVIWWALCILGVKVWLLWLIHSMYENTRSRMHVGCDLSEESSVKVGVHQGSCLSPLLFIIVLEALSQAFRTGCPWTSLTNTGIFTYHQINFLSSLFSQLNPPNPVNILDI